MCVCVCVCEREREGERERGRESERERETLLLSQICLSCTGRDRLGVAPNTPLDNTLVSRLLLVCCNMILTSAHQPYYHIPSFIPTFHIHYHCYT